VVRQYPSHLFFSYNTSLGPPYHVLMDTNFINFSIQNKIDIVSGMMDALYAKCIPYITDCVMGELEKLGTKFRGACMCVCGRCSHSIQWLCGLRVIRECSA
jgi:U3 small nucleolar RNA-associated protein 24